MFYQQTVLDNGVTVISERMDGVRSISVGVWFRIGSRDEMDAESGISHFMEHMMFKGTSKRDALAIAQDFESLGAEQNAFTSKEFTCYFSRVVDERLPEVFAILGDMVTDSLFGSEEITSEREVVIEEIARSEDTPEDYIFDLFTEASFPAHPLGRPIIGTRTIVGGFTHDDCISYRNRHYHAGNCVVVASGSVDHKQLIALCNQYLSDMPKGKRAVRDIVPAQPRPRFKLMQKETEQAHLIYGMPGIAIGDEDRFASSVLDTALGGGMSSRLFQEIREKRGLAYAVFSTTMPYIGGGQFAVYVGTRPANIEEAVQIIQTELARMLTDGLDADELERIRNYVIGHLVLGSESTSSRMLRLGKSAIAEQELLSLDEIIERYRAVTFADVERVAQRVLTQTPTVALISPRAIDEVEKSLTAILEPQ
ncbi:MAG: insulinase family protein [Coriobacteriales bacterium]|jgi:predicted Zn-dependent peptidase|nr:insulinase family protein [Coriobacteriales bacterium]